MGESIFGAYQCPGCDQWVYPFNQTPHDCPGVKQTTAIKPPFTRPWIATPQDEVPKERLSEALGTTGWICPACGKGNAPWRAQCGCEGRPGPAKQQASHKCACETIIGSAHPATPAPEPADLQHDDLDEPSGHVHKWKTVGGGPEYFTQNCVCGKTRRAPASLRHLES